MSHHKSNDLVAVLEPHFAKAPALPKNAREILVKVLPWIALVFGILGVLGSISGLGLLTVFSPLALFGGAEGVASYGTGFIAALFWLVSSVLMLAAFPGLQGHKLQGWNLMFWSEVASVVGAVLSLSLGGVLGAVIGVYLLFQIKSHYK
jgi:hypothetical protein